MYKLAAVLVACCLAPALAADDGPECPPICSIHCEFGNVEDSNGCPTCSCNAAPATECVVRGMAFSECGSRCPLTCNRRTGELGGGPDSHCPEMCVPGCFCTDGLAVAIGDDGSPSSSSCVTAAECNAIGTSTGTIVGEGETCNGSLPPQHATHCAEGLTCVHGDGGMMTGSSGVCTAVDTTAPITTVPAPTPIVTEEPVECPPVCSMHCENGFVMEEGCPICECMPAAVCVVDGVIYQDGSSWDDESGPCTQHHCENGVVMTTVASCMPPFLLEPCAGNASRVRVEGQCCEECPEATTVVPGSCSLDGVTFLDGSSWAHATDPCTTLQCASGEIGTMTISCDLQECPGGVDHIVVTGQCCPVCPDPIDTTQMPESTGSSGTIVGEGETCNGSLPPQHATHCAEGLTCVHGDGGMMTGSSGVCTAVDTTAPAPRPCVDEDGVRRASGSTWTSATAPCNHKFCLNGAIEDRTERCPRIRCADDQEYFHPVGQCCGECRARPQCEQDCRDGWVCTARSEGSNRCQQDCTTVRCATTITCSDGSAGIVPQDMCCPNCDHVITPTPLPTPLPTPTLPPTLPPTPPPTPLPTPVTTTAPPTLPPTPTPTPPLDDLIVRDTTDQPFNGDSAKSEGTDDDAGMSTTSVLVIVVVAVLLVLAVIMAVVVVQRASKSKTDNRWRDGQDAYVNPTYGDLSFKQGGTAARPASMYEHSAPDNGISDV